MTRVFVRSRVKRHRIDVKTVARVADFVLEQERVPRSAELSVLLVGLRAMRYLNRRYLKVDRDTDVLAFPLNEGTKRGSSLYLGDVVISSDRAVACAKAFNISFVEELLRYLVHGILHLTGYDDTTAHLRKRMEARQERLLNAALEKGLWNAIG